MSFHHAYIYYTPNAELSGPPQGESVRVSGSPAAKRGEPDTRAAQFRIPPSEARGNARVRGLPLSTRWLELVILVKSVFLIVIITVKHS